MEPQRYFAGELRPDQLISWRAEDGLFILYTFYAKEIEKRDKEIAKLKAERNEALKLKRWAHDDIKRVGEMLDLIGCPSIQESGFPYSVIGRLSKLTSEIVGESWRAKVNILQAKLSRLTDHADLMLDEFARIAACPGVTDEIKGLCVRGQQVIKQSAPVIVQRNTALERLARLSAVLNDDERAEKVVDKNNSDDSYYNAVRRSAINDYRADIKKEMENG